MRNSNEDLDNVSTGGGIGGFIQRNKSNAGMWVAVVVIAVVIIAAVVN